MEKYLKYKEKYLKAGAQPRITGAGVVLIESSYSRGYLGPECKEPVIILYHDINSRTYQDLGGNMETVDQNNPFMCASREFCEESNCYVNIGVGVLATVPYYDHRSYRGYLVCIPTGNFLKMNAERFLQQPPCACVRGHSHNQEMDEVARFYLSDIVHSLRTNQTNQRGDLLNVRSANNDRNGNAVSHTIFGRTKAIIREALLRGQFYESVINRIKTVNTNGQSLTIV